MPSDEYNYFHTGTCINRSSFILLLKDYLHNGYVKYGMVFVSNDRQAVFWICLPQLIDVHVLNWIRIKGCVGGNYVNSNYRTNYPTNECLLSSECLIRFISISQKNNHQPTHYTRHFGLNAVS